MLGNVKKWIDKGHVAIDSDLFPELLTESRIATSDTLRLLMEYIVYWYLAGWPTL
jgi:hypothetical protein